MKCAAHAKAFSTHSKVGGLQDGTQGLGESEERIHMQLRREDGRLQAAEGSCLAFHAEIITAFEALCSQNE
jgi:hypothetical protein